MEDSILNSVKRILGLVPDYTAFDPEILMHINMVFAVLAQMGVGPTSGFRIEDKEATWDEYLPDGEVLNMAKTYIGMKVKLVFDPPSGTSAMEAVKSTIAELEWRLNVEVDPEEEVKDEPNDDDL